MACHRSSPAPASRTPNVQYAERGREAWSIVPLRWQETCRRQSPPPSRLKWPNCHDSAPCLVSDFPDFADQTHQPSCIPCNSTQFIGSVSLQRDDSTRPVNCSTRILRCFWAAATRMWVARLPCARSEFAAQMMKDVFHSIESAHEYLGLLGEALEEAQHTIQEDIDGLTPVGVEDTARRLHALQLVSYKLDQLRHHVSASSRILNDLRTLRRLLLSVPKRPCMVGRSAGDADVE
jgi:hypothetical protein